MGMAAQEGGDFVAIAAKLHGTPAAAMRAGVVVEEQLAGRIRTTTNGSAGTFDEEFGGGAGDGSEEPFQAAFAGDKLQGPGATARDQFVVAFGDAQNCVDRLDPGRGIMLLVHDGSEDGAERFAEPADAQQNGVDRMGFVGEQRAKAGGTFFGNEASVDKEGDEFLPGKIVSGR